MRSIPTKLKTRFNTAAMALLLAFLAAVPASALNRFAGYAEKGGVAAVTSLSGAVAKFQASYPLATVTVYVEGTGTPATLASDNLGTAKSNPFLANTDGSYLFYATSNCYDVQLSGTGIATPFTKTVCAGGSSGVGAEVFVESFGAVCDGATDDYAAIDTAIDTADATPNSTVVFPAGKTCRVFVGSKSTLFTLTNGVTVKGKGTLRFDGATVGNGTISYFFVPIDESATIEELTIEGEDEFADPLTVVGATSANPMVITTSTPHGLSTGHMVYVAGLSGNTIANNDSWFITVLSPTTFSLKDNNNVALDASAQPAYTSGGTATPFLNRSTAVQHNGATGTYAGNGTSINLKLDDVHIRNVDRGVKVQTADGGLVQIEDSSIETAYTGFVQVSPPPDTVGDTRAGAYIIQKNNLYTNLGSPRRFGGGTGRERSGVLTASPFRSFIFEGNTIYGSNSVSTNTFVNNCGGNTTHPTGAARIVNNKVMGSATGIANSGMQLCNYPYTSAVETDVRMTFSKNDIGPYLTYGVVSYGGSASFLGNTFNETNSYGLVLQGEYIVNGAADPGDFGKTHDVIVSGNQFNTRGYGIGFNNYANKVIVSNNVATPINALPFIQVANSVAADGIGRPSDITIEGNQITCNGAAGIQIDGGDRIYITNNTFYGDTGGGPGVGGVWIKSTAGTLDGGGARLFTGRIWDNDFTQLGTERSMRIEVPGSFVGSNLLSAGNIEYIADPDGAGPLLAGDATTIHSHDFSSITTSTSIANTVAETAFSTSTRSIYGNNLLRLGGTIAVKAYGNASSTGTPTATLRLRWGGVTILTFPAVTVPNANTVWQLDAMVMLRTVGAAAQVIPVRGVLTWGNTVYGATNLGTVNVNTTVTGDVDLTAQWSAADPLNTIRELSHWMDVSWAARSK